MAKQERWGSRVGLVLAMAGNAVGLGNFLRFPGQAAANGGASFLVPYFICLVVLGIPLMWIEWSIGRRGGEEGHHTMPGMFQMLWKSKLAKYLGGLTLVIPAGILIYYTYIESWTLGYAWFSLTGDYIEAGRVGPGEMTAFLNEYVGDASGSYFESRGTAIAFFAVTLVANVLVLRRGLAAGIEKMALFAMPALIGIAVVLMIYVLNLDPREGGHSVSQGLGYLWNLNFDDIWNAKTWLAAAGQVFFTLSLGMGSIHCYSSYLSRKDDVTLTGLATSMTNETCEVVIGGTIALPAAFVFFGAGTAITFGTFGFGFNAFPAIFAQIGGLTGRGLGCAFFLLLFFAGITSSLAMAQPIIAFLRERFGIEQKNAALLIGAGVAVCGATVVLGGMKWVDTIDFWTGTFALVVFAFIEIVLWAFVYGVARGWEDMHHGADLQVPVFFRWCMSTVAPVLVAVILVSQFFELGDFETTSTGLEALGERYHASAFSGYLARTPSGVWMLIGSLATAATAVIAATWSKRSDA